jgi:nucleoside-diphosphate-sugar epimerase
MKALVTGGLGFIGGHLSAHLLAQGFEVDAIDNGERGAVDDQIRHMQSRKGYRLLLRDMTAGDALDGVPRDYTHVFHLAALVGVQNVVAQPYRVLRDNVVMLATILECCQTLPRLQRFVFPSTSEVYAGTLEAFGMKIPTPETTPLTVADLGRPRTAYMLSKIYGEALSRHAGLPYTILRPHNVYGPRMGLAHVIPELLERAHRTPPGGRLKIFSPRHTRSFCYIDDAIELIVRVALSPAARDATLNIGAADEEVTIAALGERVIATVCKPLTLESGPETEGSPERRKPDIAAALAAASYTPCVPLAEGLRRTYEWYRTNVFERAQASA